MEKILEKYYIAHIFSDHVETDFPASLIQYNLECFVFSFFIFFF